MRIFESRTNRAIAGTVAIAGLVYSGVTVDAWGEPELWKFAARFGLVLFSIWLLGRVMLQSRFGQVRLPQSLERWNQAYAAILAVMVVVGVAAPYFLVPNVTLMEAAALFFFGLLAATVWGTIGYVLIVLPLWAISEGAMFIWRRRKRVSTSSNGDV